MGANPKKSFYYAVQNGRSKGVYNSWAECESNVKGFKGAVYKKFNTAEEARNYAGTSTSENRYNGNATRSYPTVERGSSTSDSYTPHYNYVSHSAIVSSTPYVKQSTYVKEESPRVTSQLPKRKFEDSEYNSGYKQRKIEHSASQSTHNKVSVVYTDGASSNNGKSNARAGFGVYWGDNDPRNASVKLPGNSQTNQRAEASAVIHALEQSLDGTETLEIRTDSQYVINATTNWSKKWKKNGWKSSNGKEVENRDLFEKILDLKKRRSGDVEFVYVPGHQGVDGNEKADRLAVAGARK